MAEKYDVRPIGVFDSGLGGISVLRELRAHLPRENYVYYGDNANAPYGVRTEDEIREKKLTLFDVVTVASLVEKETAKTSESASIASFAFGLFTADIESAIRISSVCSLGFLPPRYVVFSF